MREQAQLMIYFTCKLGKHNYRSVIHYVSNMGRSKTKIPNKWVVFKDPQFRDNFDMEFIGGEFVLTAGNQKELFDSIPDDIGVHTARHTREDDAVGLLKSGF